MSVCENNYSVADKLLDNILTEKVKTKVKKASKDVDCCKKCKKKEK